MRGVGVELGQDHHPHLRRRQDARHAAGGADHQGEGPEGHRRAVRMHAEQAAPHPAAAGARPRERGERVVRERFGVDADTCTGDHSCIRLSGCPSLTIAPNPDPLRREPVTKVINSCVGCGLCGEVSHAAVLCPSFYRASLITNPTGWDRFKARVRDAVIGFFQRRMRAATRVRSRPPEAMNSARPAPDHHRHPRHGRRRRRRAGGMDRRSSPSTRATRADDLGAGRGAAHRRDQLLRRAVSQAPARKAELAARRCWG